jgi:hypothetical protein
MIFKSFLSDKLAKYQQPARIISLSEFPKTSIGKIDYQQLKNAAIKLSAFSRIQVQLLLSSEAVAKAPDSFDICRIFRGLVQWPL